MQPTELVNEIYLKLSSARDRDWRDRRHFFAIAARAMRHCLIDYARGRPSAVVLPLDTGFDLDPAQADPDFIVHVGKLLDELKEENPEWCTVVELKYFLGLNDQEAAEVMEMPVRTLQRRWQDARRWLFRRLSGADSVHPA
jgi:RNA polymerase sigma factor (TIGR02999 family)